jgi:hypothetical protein
MWKSGTAEIQAISHPKIRRRLPVTKDDDPWRMIRPSLLRGTLDKNP